MSDINLLPKKQKGNLGTDQAASILRRISIGVLSMTVLTTVVLFILVIQSSLNKVKQAENNVLAQLANYKLQLSRNVIVNERLQSIATILQQRTHFEKYITVILDKAPTNVTIQSLNVDKNKITLTGSSSSLSAANTFIDALVALQKNKDQIQSVVLKSFSVNTDSGQYFFSMDITFI